MVFVRSKVLRINKDVIQMNDDIHVQKVSKNVVHEMQKCSWCISESKWHNQLFKGTIMGSESSFPLVSFSNADQMVCMPKTNLDINVSFLRDIQICN